MEVKCGQAQGIVQFKNIPESSSSTAVFPYKSSPSFQRAGPQVVTSEGLPSLGSSQQLWPELQLELWL